MTIDGLRSNIESRRTTLWRCTGRASARQDKPCADKQAMVEALEANNHFEAYDHDCEEYGA